MGERIKSISIGFVVGLTVSGAAVANPTGANVVHGNVSFEQPDAFTLNITNSPNAIINWQDFSIAEGELTRFIQEGGNSAVLNRVVGGNLSEIYGSLTSNGRVFLINSNGIVFGENAVVDTAGLLASSLEISNDDFLNGQFAFSGDASSGSIVNRGMIAAGADGEIVLIAPQIENHGVLQVDGGQLILAAGEKVTLSSFDLDGVEFEVQAPENEILNLGQLIAEKGAVGLFAGSIAHEGRIEANSLSLDAEGNIVLSALDSVSISETAEVSADGARGGQIVIASEQGDTVIRGSVSATGSLAEGGNIEITGERVGLFDAAEVDASGATGGGEILVGGDFQGQGDTQTASTTVVNRDAVVKADAIESGDGGKVIVWADGHTAMHGRASAQGGKNTGDGGFIEISGKEHLSMVGEVDTSAANGEAGTVLFDPQNLIIDTNGTALPAGTIDFNAAPIAALDDTSIAEFLQNNGSVILRANNDITFNDGATIIANSTPPDRALTVEAGRSIAVRDGVMIDIAGNITFDANLPMSAGIVVGEREAGPGGITIGNGALTTIRSGGNILLQLRDGMNVPGATVGDIVVNANAVVESAATNANAITLANAPAGVAAGNTTINGTVRTNNGGIVVDTGEFTLGPGATFAAINAANGLVNITAENMALSSALQVGNALTISNKTGAITLGNSGLPVGLHLDQVEFENNLTGGFTNLTINTTAPGQDILVDSALTTPRNIQLSAAGGINFRNAVSALNTSGSGNIVLNSGTVIRTDSENFLSTQGGNVTLNSTLQLSNPNTRIATGGTSTSGDIQLNGAVAAIGNGAQSLVLDASGSTSGNGRVLLGGPVGTSTNRLNDLRLVANHDAASAHTLLVNNNVFAAGNVTFDEGRTAIMAGRTIEATDVIFKVADTDQVLFGGSSGYFLDNVKLDAINSSGKIIIGSTTHTAGMTFTNGINQAGKNIVLQTQGGISTTVSAGQDIVAESVELLNSAGGSSIGSNTMALKLDVNTLRGDSSGAVFIREANGLTVEDLTASQVSLAASTGNISINRIRSDGNVSINARSGAIVDVNTGGANIDEATGGGGVGDVMLQAARGIGDVSNIIEVGHITGPNSLSVNNQDMTTPANTLGDIHIVNTSNTALNLGNITNIASNTITDIQNVAALAGIVRVGDINISNGGMLNLIASNGNISGQSGADITSDGTVNILANNGSIVFGEGNVVNVSNLDLSAGAAISQDTSTSTVNVTNLLTANAAQGIDLSRLSNSINMLQASNSAMNNISIGTLSGLTVTGTGIRNMGSTGSNIMLTSMGELQVDAIIQANNGNVQLTTSSGNIDIDQQVRAQTGNISLTTSGSDDIEISNRVEASGNITIDAGRNVTIMADTAPVEVRAGSLMTINSQGNGDLLVHGSDTNPGVGTLLQVTGGNLNIGQTGTFNNITIEGGDAPGVAQSSMVDGAGAHVTASGDINITVNNLLQVEGGAGNASDAHIMGAGQTVINAGSVQVLGGSGNEIASTDMSSRRNAGARIQGNVLNITTTSSVNDVQINAGSGTNSSASLRGDSSVTLNSGASIQVVANGGSADISSVSSVDVTAANDLNLQGGSQANATASIGAEDENSLAFDSTTINIDAQNITLNTGTGSMALAAIGCRTCGETTIRLGNGGQVANVSVNANGAADAFAMIGVDGPGNANVTINSSANVNLNGTTGEVRVGSTSGGGTVSILAGQPTSEGRISLGNARIQTTGNVLLNARGSTSGNGTIDQTAAGRIIASGLGVAANNDLGADINLIGNNNVTTATLLSLNTASNATGSGNITFNEVDGFQLETIAMAPVNKSLATSGTSQITSGGAVTQNSATGHEVDVASLSIRTDSTGAAGINLVNSANSVLGPVTLEVLNGGALQSGDINITATNTIQVASMRTLGNVGIDANSINQTGVIEGNHLGVNAVDGIVLNNTGNRFSTVSATNTGTTSGVDIFSNQSLLNVSGSATTGNTFRVAANGSLAIGLISGTGSTVSLDAQNGMITDANPAPPAAINIGDTGTINFQASDGVGGGSAIRTVAGNINVTRLGGDVLIDNSGTLTLGNVDFLSIPSGSSNVVINNIGDLTVAGSVSTQDTTTGSITLTSDTDITVNTDINAQTNVTLNAMGALTVNNQVFANTGQIDLDSGANLIVGNNLAAGNGLDLNAAGGGLIIQNNAVLTAGASGNINLAANSAVSQSATSSIIASTGTTTTVNAMTGIGLNSATNNFDVLNVTNAGSSGGILINDSNNITLENINQQAVNNVVITASGNFELNNLGTATVDNALLDVTANNILLRKSISANAVNLDASAAGGTFTMVANRNIATDTAAGITVVADGNLTVNQLNTTAGNGQVTVTSNNGSILDLSNTSDGVTQTAFNINAGTGAVTLQAANGSIGDVASADGDFDIIAGSTTINGVNDVLSLNTSSDIDLGGRTGLRAINVRSGGNITSANAGPISTINNGNINLDATGTITLDQQVAANGSGTVTVQSGGALNASQNITSGTGNIQLGGNGVTHTSGSDITTAGAISVNAGSGNLTMDNGSEYNATTGGNIMLNGANIALGQLSTSTGTAVVTATGSIANAAGAPTNITAATVQLMANSGIGTSMAAVTTEAANLSASNNTNGVFIESRFSGGDLNLTSVTNNGDIVVSNPNGNVNLGELNAMTGMIDLDVTAGQVRDANGANVNLRGANVDVTALNGIGTVADALEFDATALSAVTSNQDLVLVQTGSSNLQVNALARTNAGAGEVQLTSQAPTTIAGTGVAGTDSNITINTSGNALVIDAPVVSNGNVSLSASTQTINHNVASLGGNLLLNGGIQINDRTGGTTVEAANTLTVNGSGLTMANGPSGGTVVLEAQNVNLNLTGNLNLNGSSGSGDVVLKTLGGVLTGSVNDVNLTPGGTADAVIALNNGSGLFQLAFSGACNGCNEITVNPIGDSTGVAGIWGLQGALFTNAGGDFQWDNPLNWSGSAVPSMVNAILTLGGGNTVIVDSNVADIANLTASDNLNIVAGGDLRVTGVSNVTGNLDINGGVLTLVDMAMLANVSINSGSLNLQGTGNSASNLVLNGGNLSISNDFTAASANWNGGNMIGGGQYTVGSVDTLDIAANGGNLDVNLGITGLATLNNANINVQTGRAINNMGQLRINGASRIEGAGTLNNNGMLQRASGTETASIALLSNNEGTIDVAQGGLRFDGNYSSTNGALTLNGGNAEFNANSSFAANASIDGSGRVRFASGTHNLDMNTGSLSSGSTANTALEVATGATVNILNDQADIETVELTGGTLNLAGTTYDFDVLTLNNGALNDTGSGSLLVVNNALNWTAGTLAKDTQVNGVLTVDGNATASNSLSVNGTANLNNGGVLHLTQGGTTHTGNFNLADGSRLELGNPGVSASFAQFFNGNVGGAGDVVLHNFVTANFGGVVNLSGDLTTANGVNASFAQNSSLGQVSLVSGASLSGSGTVVDIAALTTTGAAQFNGVGQTFNVNGNAVLNGFRSASGATTNFNGNTDWNSDDLGGGSFPGVPGGAINNSGVFNINTAGIINSSQFVNAAAGQININAPGVVTVNNGNFDNQGRLNLNSGSLANVAMLAGVVNWSGGAFANPVDITGTLNVSGNQTASNALGLAGNAVIANDSSLTLTQSTSHTGNVTISEGASLVLAGGAAQTQDFMGNVSGAGSLRVQDDVQASFDNALMLGDSLVATGSSTINLNADSMINSVQLADGTSINLQNAALTMNNLRTAGSAMLGGSGATYRVNQQAEINGFDSATGVTLALAGTTDWNGGNFGGASTIENSGTLNAHAGGTVAAQSFTNSGDINLISGATVFSNALSQSAGSLNLNGGNLQTTALNISGGSLNGSGEIRADVSVANADINPGQNGAGSIAIDGDLTLAGGTTYNVEIAGNADTEYDRLRVSGTANIGNDTNLVISLINGFAGNLADLFTPLAYADSSGQFTNQTDPNGYVFTPEYLANSLALTITQVPFETPDTGDEIAELLEDFEDSLDELEETSEEEDEYEQISQEEDAEQRTDNSERVCS